MNQFKFSLGPYEFFSAIIGGVPLFMAISLLYNPFSSVQELVPIFQKNASLSNVFVILFLSYLLGVTVHGLSWRYFQRLCSISNKSYRYFGDQLLEKSSQFRQREDLVDPSTLNFEDHLAFLLSEKVGIPEGFKGMDSMVTAYLREHNKQETLTVAELQQATHIMHRTWSLGFCMLSLVLFVNIFRTSTHTVEQFVLPLVMLILARLAFLRALCFKKWHSREILLGFYFSCVNRHPGEPQL